MKWFVCLEQQELKRLKELEEENNRLKKMYADARWNYQSKNEDTGAIAKLNKLAVAYPVRAFDEYYYKFDVKRSNVIETHFVCVSLYEVKFKMQMITLAKQSLITPLVFNECWSMNFICVLNDGRKVRIFNAIDDCNREAIDKWKKNHNLGPCKT